jgi:2-oxo-4-hydroxy-4-carboxy-5-ureidoimidazoline decarboxylase
MMSPAETSPAPHPAPLTIDRINTLPPAELTSLFRQCVAVTRWAHALADARPFTDLADLRSRADELTAALTDAELRTALADHPRIGQRADAGSATANWSRTEQSGVDGRDTGLAERLHAGNLAYERRFGHIYLVCATGRDGADLLADLTDRLANDPVAELDVVRGELGKIARLRLGKLVAA